MKKKKMLAVWIAAHLSVGALALAGSSFIVDRFIALRSHDPYETEAKLERLRLEAEKAARPIPLGRAAAAMGSFVAARREGDGTQMGPRTLPRDSLREAMSRRAREDHPTALLDKPCKCAACEREVDRGYIPGDGNWRVCCRA